MPASHPLADMVSSYLGILIITLVVLLLVGVIGAVLFGGSK